MTPAARMRIIHLATAGGWATVGVKWLAAALGALVGTLYVPVCVALLVHFSR